MHAHAALAVAIGAVVDGAVILGRVVVHAPIDLVVTNSNHPGETHCCGLNLMEELHHRNTA